VATSLENYAALLRETDREDKAEEMEARAQAIRTKRAQENPVEWGLAMSASGYKQTFRG
jgi:hypothetical protein